MRKEKRELGRRRRVYMKRRRKRARRKQYLLALGCAGLAAACLFSVWGSREQILSLSQERRVEFCLEREDGTRKQPGQREKREKERENGLREEGGQERGRATTRFGIVFRLEDGELTLYRERQETE